MNILGYLITMANLQQWSNDGSPLKDTTLHVGTLYELTKELVSIPGFPLEGYRKNGFQKHGKLAVYPSTAVRDFIFDGEGSPDDQGIIIKLHYGDKADVSSKYDTVAYFIHGDKVDDHVHQEVNEYLKDMVTRTIVKGRRNKRSLLDKLIS